MPSQRLLDDCIDVGEAGTVVDPGHALCAYDQVKLGLSFPESLGVQSHRHDACQYGGVCLQRASNNKIIVMHEVRVTVSLPAVKHKRMNTC